MRKQNQQQPKHHQNNENESGKPTDRNASYCYAELVLSSCEQCYGVVDFLVTVREELLVVVTEMSCEAQWMLCLASPT